MAKCQAGDQSSCDALLSRASGYQFQWALGYRFDLGSPQQVMDYFQKHPQSAFPFSLGQCSAIKANEVCDLVDVPLFNNAPVVVSGVTRTSFTFTSQKGHFDPAGSTVSFSVYEHNGFDYLQQTGIWNATDPAEIAKAYATEPGAWITWSQQAKNLGNAINPHAGADLFSAY